LDASRPDKRFVHFGIDPRLERAPAQRILQLRLLIG
jgi:hypothetical protein